MRNPAATDAPRTPLPVPRAGRWVAPALGAAAFLGSALTFDGPGITIDEPIYAKSAWLQRQWFGDLLRVRSRSDLARVFSGEWVRRRWICHGVRGLNYHPPGLQYLHNATWLMLLGRIPEPWPGRLGGALLLGLCTWALVRMVSRGSGLAGGAAAGVALATMPRVFGHSHLAATDFPLLAGWLLSTWAWMRAGEAEGRLRRCVLVVPVLGFTLLLKFTALGVFLPLWAWVLLYRRRLWRRFLVVSVCAGLFALLLDVPLWGGLPGSLVEYFRQSLGRGRFFAITCYYQGRTYLFDLPWHNGFVLTGITVPAGVLFLAGLGASAVVAGRFRDGFGTLCLVNVALFLLVRALPTPSHDGVRLFLPMFAFVAGLAGIGVGWLLRGAGGFLGGRGRWASRIRAALPFLAVAALAGYGLVQVVPIHPFQLSYYNELAGGVSGAVARGYQATYWYDALTREAYRRLNAVLPPGARVLAAPPLPAMSREVGRLRRDVVVTSRPPADFVLVLLRQDNMDETAWALHRGEKGRRVAAVEYDGVPLIALYRYRVEPPLPSGRESRRGSPAGGRPPVR